VLVGTDFRRTEKLLIPNQAYFDHMVACIDRPDGSVRCLDPTDAYTPWNEISSGIEGDVNLGMIPGRVAEFPRSGYLWQINVATPNTISASGDVLEQQRREFVGTWASSMRSALRSRDRDERGRFLTDGYREVIGEESSAPQFDVDELDTNDAPLVVRSQLAYPALIGAPRPPRRRTSSSDPARDCGALRVHLSASPSCRTCTGSSNSLRGRRSDAAGGRRSQSARLHRAAARHTASQSRCVPQE
jgi:hypothetical protein